MAERKIPANFDALYDNAARSARGVSAQAAPRAALTRMRAAVPNVAVQLDAATQNPVQVTVTQQGTGERLSTRAAASPEAATQQFLKDNADLWQLDDHDLGTVAVVSSTTQGLPTVRMIQKVGDVEVFQSDMTAALGSDHSIVAVTGQLFHGAAGAPERATARAATAMRAGTAELGAEAAIAKAAFDLTGYAYQAGDFKPARTAARRQTGPYSFYDSKWKQSDASKAAPAKKAATKKSKAKKTAKAAPAKPEPPPFTRPVRVKNVLFPLGEGQFVPGYYIELWIADYPAFSYVIDKVDTPDILFRKNLTSSATFKYRVHNTGDAISRPEDGPAPGTPHPNGRPDNFQAATIPEKLIEIESLLPNRPWLAAGATSLRGNNCIAYADLKPPEGPSAGDVEGKTTGTRTFDTKYNHAKPASDPKNLQASLVGMFFHVNWLHDRWYEAGFDEKSGNAQQDNFGLGGLDGDPILAGGNHFSGTDNAFMSTPADGDSPHMHMFRFDGPNPLPSRTSNHEALITFHEMGHYITNRLVANASGLGNTQGRAMGEGWGDFFAVSMTSQATDDFAKGVFAVGGWTDIRPDFKQNYYYSIRRYPYTADMSKNPLTFKHISDSVVLPSNPPMNPIGNSNAEFHNAGEIWCCMLWEVFVNLVTKHGHDDGEKRMLRYVVGGLKLTPARPTFVQARDGILSAANALDPADVPLIWKGFAKRGIGKNAVAPPSSSVSLTEVVENFDVP